MTGRTATTLYEDIFYQSVESSTYDHRTLKTRLPVRSALFKQRTGGLVVRWVTTSEYPQLYVFAIFSIICKYFCATRRCRMRCYK
jgi:hypothetical protein